jgi:hypothetical protein
MAYGPTVAREYGIPAVICVPAATTRIRNGQLITVDGARARSPWIPERETPILPDVQKPRPKGRLPAAHGPGRADRSSGESRTSGVSPSRVSCARP